MSSPTFVAIDFETADYQRDSACAVGLVKVRNGRIVEEQSCLIRPPRQNFHFTHIHGITWQDVAGEPRFRSVWLKLRPMLEDAEFLAAHNAPFDRGVLYSCCNAARLRPPIQNFRCTVQLARHKLSIRPATLPDVCRELRISLDHHDPLSDARACAEIVMHAGREGMI